MPGKAHLLMAALAAHELHQSARSTMGWGAFLVSLVAIGCSDPTTVPPDAGLDQVLPTSMCVTDGDCVMLGQVSALCCQGSCVDASMDIQNCGRCQNACTASPHATPVCLNAVCSIEMCAAGFFDCDKRFENGCEVDAAIDAKNCGQCANECRAGTNQSPACTQGICRAACDSGFGDCDGDDANGCEVNLGNDSKNCTACGRPCNPSERCRGGVCSIPPPSDWTQKTPPVVPPARFNHAMVYDSARRVVVLFGGRSRPKTFLADTWEWDGITWRRVNTVHSPGGRDGHGISYDSARGVVVVYGGEFNDPCTDNFEDTWEYDGNDWTEVKTNSRPPLRFGPAMAYDAQRKVTVLHGGSGCSVYGDTWQFDGKDWEKRNPVHSPGLLYSNAMVYDGGRGFLVNFGGSNGLNEVNDTWEFDGVDWTNLSIKNSPDPRVATALAWSADLGVTVLFGGIHQAVRLGDTWEWNGFEWLKKAPVHSPSARSGMAITYDSARRQVVLFGGGTFGADLNDTYVYGP